MSDTVQRSTLLIDDVGLGASKGAIFRLDPLVDHEAFNVLVRWGPQMNASGPEEVMETLPGADDVGSRILASRGRTSA